MRVNVQLIDAETGNHLWAERFDKPVADLFDMQDEIVARLANGSNTQLVAAEARRAERAPPTPWTSISRAWPESTQGFRPEFLAQARGSLSARWRLILAISTRSSARRLSIRSSLSATWSTTGSARLASRRRRRWLSRCHLAPDHALAHEGNRQSSNLHQPRCPRHRRMRARAAVDRNVATASATMVLASSWPAARRKLRPMSARRYASLPVTIGPLHGCDSLAPPNSISARTQRQSAGWGDPSKPIEMSWLSQFYLGTVSGLAPTRPRKPALRLRPALRWNLTFTISRFRAGVGEQQRDLPRPAPTRL